MHIDWLQDQLYIDSSFYQILLLIEPGKIVGVCVLPCTPHSQYRSQQSYVYQ